MNVNNEENYLFEKSENELLSRFETMLSKEDVYYFDIYEFIEIIEIYLDTDNLNRAKTAVELGLKQHPQSSELLVKKAHLLVESQKYKEAKTILESIGKIEPSNPDILFLLGIVNLYHYETTIAKEYFNKALAENNDEAEELILNIAIHFQNVNLYDQAIDFLLKGFQINSTNADILYELAFSFERTGELEKSSSYYNAYLDINPFSEYAWYNIALVYDKMEQFEKALEAFNFALAIDDEYSLAYYGKGNILANMDKYNEAAEVFKEAIPLDPENDELMYFIGECYEKLRDDEKALLYYKRSLKLNDKNPNAWFGIGIIRYYKNELFESLFYVKKALKINPDDSEYWTILGKINEKLDFYEDAETALKKALDIDPDDVKNWIRYSKLLYKQEKIEEAVEVLTEANKNIKNNGDIIYSLSAYLLESNQHNKALKYFKLGLKINYEMHKNFFQFDSKKIFSLSVKNLLKKR